MPAQSTSDSSSRFIVVIQNAANFNELLGADQDFQFHRQAWEIKTVHVDASTISISSERQLFSSERLIRLVVMSMEEATESDGISLNALVDQLRSRLGDQSVARDALDERLLASGFIGRAEYDRPRFAIGQVRTFQVDSGFPRLTPREVMTGVVDVKYNLMLESCMPFEIEDPLAAQ